LRTRKRSSIAAAKKPAAIGLYHDDFNDFNGFSERSVSTALPIILTPFVFRQRRIRRRQTTIATNRITAYNRSRGEVMKQQEIIDVSPDVLEGTPVFRGTRVPVRTLIDTLEAGDSIDLFLYDFPSVAREQVVAFLEITKERLLATA
jgi:uncharacterized protein (DUF433 family)